MLPSRGASAGLALRAPHPPCCALLCAAPAPPSHVPSCLPPARPQVLGPLGAADLVWVGALPAVSEELLFRGALIPAIYPDWRGALIAGLAFGVLHNSGGRNPAFAAWASLVGTAYGALFLATGSVACPALAHSLANIASGALWRATHGGGGGGSK